MPWRREWQPTPVFLPGESSWTEKPGGLQSMGSQRVRYNWVTKHSTLMLTNILHTWWLFVCHLWKKYLFNPIAHYSRGLFDILLLNYISPLNILYNHLLDTWFANIFSYSIGCLFIFSIIYLTCKTFWAWSSPTYFCFYRLCSCFNI